MSRRSTSGSRFEALPVEGEDSDSDSSVEEMKLSQDFYQTNIAGAKSSAKSRDSESSVEEMKLSQEFYPTAVLSDHGGALGQPPYSDMRNMSAAPEAGPSGLQAFQGMSTGSKGQPVSLEERSGIEFAWDHYTKQPDDVGLNVFDETSQQIQDLPQSIEQDIPFLSDIGFNIEYPEGKIGEGFYGTVYRGHYATGAPNLPQSMFAVKIMDFGSKSDSETIEKRQMFETEKYILTNACHRNIVAIRMIINMGGMRSFPFLNNPSLTFLSPQRIYMIMDFADSGELDNYLSKNSDKMEPSIRINFIRDLFAGLQYLHYMGIVHGDVHSGNVLLFTANDGELVAKWADFGLGFVDSNKQFRFEKVQQTDLSQKFISDIYNMGTVFASLTRDRQKGRPEAPEEKKLLDEMMKMTKQIRRDKFTSLAQVYQQYRHILEDELIFYEQHFQ